jgi:hypothetical protein
MVDSVSGSCEIFKFFVELEERFKDCPLKSISCNTTFISKNI